LSDQHDGKNNTPDASADATGASESVKTESVKPSPANEMPARPVPDKSERNADEDKHEPKSNGSITEQEFVDRIRKSDRWMISLTAIAAFAAIASAVIFGWQLHIMNNQLEIMEAQNRPWLSVQRIDADKDLMGISVGNTGDVKGGFGVYPEVTVKNVGPSVAIGAFVADKLIPVANSPLEFVGILRTQTTFCDSIRAEMFHDPRVTGDTIFPGDAKQLADANPDDMWIKASEVNKFATTYNGVKYIRLALVGCVEYQFYAYPQRFQTRFAYIIKVKNGLVDLIPIGKDVAAERTVIEPYLFGNSYAD